MKTRTSIEIYVLEISIDSTHWTPYLSGDASSSLTVSVSLREAQRRLKAIKSDLVPAVANLFKLRNAVYTREEKISGINISSE